MIWVTSIISSQERCKLRDAALEAFPGEVTGAGRDYASVLFEWCRSAEKRQRKRRRRKRSGSISRR